MRGFPRPPSCGYGCDLAAEEPRRRRLPSNSNDLRAVARFEFVGRRTVTAISRVYVVDDDDLVRSSLTLQLRADYDVMCFGLARHFLEAAPALPPGCLLLDVHMPEVDGLEVQRRLARRNLHFPTVMITGQGDVRIAVEAMKAGAVDFVEKPFTREAIVQSLNLAQRRLVQPIAGGDGKEAAIARLASLTERERQVLNGLVAGLPNKTVAYDLGISARTVEVHRARIMSKTRVRNFSGLVRLAVAAGIEGRG
jgi:two-component system, LuxR family, response regulator FixJ